MQIGQSLVKITNRLKQSFPQSESAATDVRKPRGIPQLLYTFALWRVLIPRWIELRCIGSASYYLVLGEGVSHGRNPTISNLIIGIGKGDRFAQGRMSSRVQGERLAAAKRGIYYSKILNSVLKA